MTENGFEGARLAKTQGDFMKYFAAQVAEGALTTEQIIQVLNNASGSLLAAGDHLYTLQTELSLYRGLYQSAAGDTVSRGSFAEYLDEDQAELDPEPWVSETPEGTSRQSAPSRQHFTFRPGQGYSQKLEDYSQQLDPEPWAWGLSRDWNNPMRAPKQETSTFVFLPRAPFNPNREDYK